MTPEERAEKIILPLYLACEPDICRDVRDRIAAQINDAVEEAISAAVDEAICEHHSIHNPTVSHIIQRKAYEDAAKIIEGFTILDPIGAAVAIRARAAEVGK